jgi:hypothetical protein
MASTEKNPRLGRYIVKKFGDESFRGFVPPNLPPKPPALMRREQAVRRVQERLFGSQEKKLKRWSGCRDLNSGPLAPQAALAK